MFIVRGKYITPFPSTGCPDPLAPPGGETMEQICAILVISLITIVSIGTFCKFSEKNIQPLFREGSLYTGCQNDNIYINNA